MPKPITYPNIGIYARFEDGNHWSSNQAYKSPKTREKIIRRLIAWQAKNQGKIKLLKLYDNRSASDHAIIHQSPKEFRIWLKYNHDHITLAKNKTKGTSTIPKPCHGFETEETAAVRIVGEIMHIIGQGHIWQARIYDPAGAMVFHWTNLESYKIGHELALKALQS